MTKSKKIVLLINRLCNSLKYKYKKESIKKNMKLKQKLFKLIKECLGIEKQDNSLIEPNRVEIVDLPKDLVINLNKGGKNGKK
jgi:hypothetical protein